MSLGSIPTSDNMTPINTGSNSWMSNNASLCSTVHSCQQDSDQGIPIINSYPPKRLRRVVFELAPYKNVKYEKGMWYFYIPPIDKEYMLEYLNKEKYAFIIPNDELYCKISDVYRKYFDQTKFKPVRYTKTLVEIDNREEQIKLIKKYHLKVYKARKIVPIIQNNFSCSYPIMQKVTLGYNDEEIYEINDCLDLNTLICKGSLVETKTCETEILYKMESDKCQTVSIKCLMEQISQISPKAIYMYFNKTTEVSVKCNNRQETLWTKESNILYGENCELKVAGTKLFQTKEKNEKIIIANIETQKVEAFSEIELTYDDSEIKSKLKQLKQIQYFSENTQHEIIQCIWITSLTIIIIIVIQGLFKKDNMLLLKKYLRVHFKKKHIEHKDNNITRPYRHKSQTEEAVISTPWTSKNEFIKQ
ncbi:unnamed protein product [Leptidea sinapis]|uniref:Uncharacterized protein n=1 Tax=Leptidea sinapis TaxID=189913 RepID=A0A5E4PMX1_9NEOP|nr:unnamed protein product [Leptidea sinapis]